MWWVFGVAVAGTGSLEGFAGTWRLDAAASERLEPLLVARGVPWPLRKLAAAMEPSMTVQVVDGGLVVRTDDPRGEREDRIVPDGEARTAEGREGPVVCRSAWSDGFLATTCRLGNGELEVRRRVEEAVWTQWVRFTPDGGVPVVVKRVFRR